MGTIYCACRKNGRLRTPMNRCVSGNGRPGGRERAERYSKMLRRPAIACLLPYHCLGHAGDYELALV